MKKKKNKNKNKSMELKAMVTKIPSGDVEV